MFGNKQENANPELVLSPRPSPAESLSPRNRVPSKTESQTRLKILPPKRSNAIEFFVSTFIKYKFSSFLDGVQISSRIKKPIATFCEALLTLNSKLFGADIISQMSILVPTQEETQQLSQVPQSDLPRLQKTGIHICHFCAASFIRFDLLLRSIYVGVNKDSTTTE